VREYILQLIYKKERKKERKGNQQASFEFDLRFKALMFLIVVSHFSIVYVSVLGFVIS
jgi:hypothetical protein